MKKIIKSGHLAGVIFAVIFGFSFMFTKTALEHVPPMGLIAYRFLIAFLIFEILRITKVVKIKFRKNYVLPVFLVALFQPVLYFIFETFGVDRLSSSEAGMMIALIPIFVTILSSIILNEKPNKYQVMFITLSMFGLFLIQIFKLNEESTGSFIGFFLLLMAVISAALFNIASRNASKIYKPYELTYFMMLSGAVVFNAIYLFQLITSDSLPMYISSLNNITVISSVLYLGIVASIIGFFLVNFTLYKLPAHVSSIYSNLSTIVAVIAGYIILDEAIYWYHIVGGIMIIIGVYGAARMNVMNISKKEKKDDQCCESLSSDTK